MRRFFHRFITKTRTLRVNILTLFLTLIIVAFAFVMTFTYEKNYKAIIQFSKIFSEKVDDMIVERFTDIALGAEQITQIAAGFFFDFGNLSIDNKAYTSLMLNVVKYDPHYSNFYIGLSDGSFLGAFDMSVSAQSTYATDPTKPLPADTRFSLHYVNLSSQPPSDTWYYLNDKFKTISSENLPPGGYDARKRPWFQGAVQTNALYWTDFYPFFPSNEKGITIANPVFDKSGKIAAVVGADLTFVQLATFLQSQKIGKTGKAYIVDSQGKILIPKVLRNVRSGITPELVVSIIERYQSNPQRPDLVIESEGVDYLAYVTPAPIVTGKGWKIVVIAPINDFFSSLLVVQKQVMLIIFGVLAVASLIVIYFAKRISSPIVTLANEVDKIRQLELSSEVRVKSNIKEIFLMDAAIASLRRATRSFARYVPKEVVKELFHKGEEIVLGGEKKQITIFFSDIASFTSIAETHSIDVLIPLLTEYFDNLCRIILESHGTIDKFMGDGIMAFWGAPEDIPDHATRACTTALRCSVAVNKLNQKRRAEGKPEFPTRFGINTGTVIVGNIGTSDRINYTVIGDAVNITSRLQEVDKFYHTTIIISEDVHKQLKDAFVVRPLDFVAVKGKTEKIRIFELLAKLQGEPEISAQPSQIELSKIFTEAYEAFWQKDYGKARTLFQNILQKFPDDFPTQIYLKRLDERKDGS